MTDARRLCDSFGATAASPSFTYPPLHRHRRKSSQPSPPSPTFPRRPFDRAGRAVESPSSIDSPLTQNVYSESPSADAFWAQGAAPELVHYAPRRPTRLSGEESRPYPTLLADLERPLTSGAIDAKHTISLGVGSGPSVGLSNRPSPWPGHARRASAVERGSNESIRIGSSQSPLLALSSSLLQPGEKSLAEDPMSAKNVPGKKSRLNLLNPMSLLARRRSAQSQNDGSLLTINTMHVPALPDNFEPSIRGTITHDFSAPRTRKNPSYDYGHHVDAQFRLNSAQIGDKPSPRQASSGGLALTTHSPVFKEHFQDDQPAFHLEQTSSLLKIASRSVSAEQLEANMPAFAKKLPVRLPDHGAPVATPSQPRPPPAVDVAHVDRPLQDSLSDHTGPLPDHPRPLSDHPGPLSGNPPPVSDYPPPPPPKRTPSPKANLPPASLLPKHMTSTSSRFSFQLAEYASSAQERLLEEKHKQFQSTKRTSSLFKRESVDDIDYDDYDLDAEDVEEAIPEVNFDYDEDAGFGSDDDSTVDRSRVQRASGLYLQQPLQSFHFTPQSLTVSSASTGETAHPTPRDRDGFAIGIADGNELSEPGCPVVALGGSSGPGDDQDLIAALGGLGISSSRLGGDQDPSAVLRGSGISNTTLNGKDEPGPTQTRPLNHGGLQIFDDADLYFDDGEFGGEVEPSHDGFDESVLDDDTKIRDIPAENARRYEAAIQIGGPACGQSKIAGSQQSPTSAQKTRQSDGLSGDGEGRSGSSRAVPKPYTGPGLTEGNLEAYHHALAQAATDAAANGRFSRKVSFDASEESQPGLTSDEGRLSLHYGSSRIAEDDGSEMVNGGFFAACGSNGVKRSHSGRANFQEPSLTPITERSEWSTRNSVVSLQIPGGAPLSAQSLPSAGIAQLLELDSPAHDEDMTLSALMKLRRGAFGSSSTSINSLSAGGHASSPSLVLAVPHPFAAPPEHGLGRMGSPIHGLTAATAGIPESEEEENDGFANDGPTPTPNTPMKKQKKGEADGASPHDQALRSPGSDSSERRRAYHSRNSSGAESVSYARESDGRWVLERRRTGEDGGVEVDREYLLGARI
ncbi:hypothetical protein DV737_g2610, partial [Chaetothyriales sp. CBS 132003]